MSSENNYKPGDYFVQCDRTGFKIRASASKREWQGRVVREQDWEPRHPQDFVRGKRDEQRVPFYSLEGTDTFLDPNDVTEDSL